MTKRDNGRHLEMTDTGDIKTAMIIGLFVVLGSRDPRSGTEGSQLARKGGYCFVDPSESGQCLVSGLGWCTKITTTTLLRTQAE